MALFYKNRNVAVLSAFHIYILLLIKIDCYLFAKFNVHLTKSRGALGQLPPNRSFTILEQPLSSKNFANQLVSPRWRKSLSKWVMNSRGDFRSLYVDPPLKTWQENRLVLHRTALIRVQKTSKTPQNLGNGSSVPDSIVSKNPPRNSTSSVPILMVSPLILTASCGQFIYSCLRINGHCVGRINYSYPACFQSIQITQFPREI